MSELGCCNEYCSQRTETVNASEPTLRVMTGMAIEKESGGQDGDIRVY